MVDGRYKVVQLIILADAGAGILLVHLADAPGVAAGELLELTIAHEYRAEGHAELDVVVRNILLDILTAAKLRSAEHAEVAVRVDEQHIARGLIAAQLPLIHAHAEVAVLIIVGIHGDDGVRASRQLGRHSLLVRAEGVVHELAAYL